MGATRDQVLQRYGEPKSQIATGSREIMFFARERVILRNGIVVEVELLPAEPPVRRAPAAAPAPPATAAVPASAATVTDPAMVAALQAQAQARAAAAGMPIAGVPVQPNVAAPAPGVAPGVVAVPGAPIQPVGAPVGTAELPVAAPPPPPPAPEPQLAIKFVRPPSAGGVRPAAPESTPQPSAPQRDEPASAPQPPVAATVLDSGAKPSPGSPAASPKPVGPEPTAPAATSATKKTVPAAAPIASTEVKEPETPSPEEVAPSEPKKAKAPRAKSRAWRRRLHEDDFPEPVESIFTVRTYTIALVVIVAGGGYLLWRRHQRQLELAASAVSHTPFSAGAATGSGAMFDAALLTKLEWKRFEELVASYYVKTGVVAVRTKSGPASPVHVKISWKGEPRPFACVQCIAHPVGLIEAKPIQELYEVLAADDIRRGYVVSTGRFSIPARDFAEEKHLTLLSGDLLLEKLNALPDSARSELMEEITAGDYTTPSCPVCEAKAVRKSDESSGWTCRSHPDAVIPAPP